MKSLTDTKQELKALIPGGIDVAIRGLKAALAEGTDRYNDLLLLEGRYQDMTRLLLQGVVSDEAAQIQFNKIRKDLLEFIDGLQPIHFSAAQKSGIDGKPDLYNGEVLYRIPKQMQKQEETKCLVRLAFDRAIITQDLDPQKDDVLKDLRISEVMGVELLDPKGTAFEIRTLYDTVQFVEKDLFTEWVFFVKPMQEGIHPLVLKISIIEIKDGIERKRNVVLEEQVAVVAISPEKDGQAEAFANTGIALTVAQPQQGLEELPVPRPGSVPNSPVPPPPAAPVPSAPSPSAARRPKSSFRKMAAALSAMAVVLIASWSVWNSLSTNNTTVNPVEPDPGSETGGKSYDDANEPISLQLASRPPIFSGCNNESPEAAKTCTDQKIENFIRQNLSFPAGTELQKIKGIHTIEITIEKDGSVSDVQFNQDLGGDFIKEAVRLMRQLPPFEPGLNQLGQPARIRYVLPIRFDLQ